MKRLFVVMSAATVMVTLSSCWTTNIEKNDMMKLELEDQRAHAQLRKAYTEMRSKRYYFAREIARPLIGHKLVGREAQLLLKQIEYQINYRNIRQEQELSGKIALGEVEKRLILPENYGKRLKYDPKVGPFVLEPGPMEDLLKKPVKIDVEGADLAAILQALKDISPVNLISDEDLEVERALTIKVSDVPLRDVLSYIERNMGLKFLVTKNVIWVTQGEATEGEVSPKLETRIIRLRKGYIPAGAKGGGDNTNGGGGRGGRGGGLQGGGQEQGNGEGEDDLYDALTTFLEGLDSPEDAMFEIYRNRNILVIRDTRDNVRLVQQLIDAFDRDPMQVMIETRFITIKQSDLFGLGTKINNLSKGEGAEKINVQDITDLDGDGDTTEFRQETDLEFQNRVKGILGNTDRLVNTTASTLLGLGNTTGSVSFQGVLDGFMYDLTLGALEQMETSKTMSAPRITVVNNHKARIRRGSKKYYFDEFEAADNDFNINNGGIVNPGVPGQNSTIQPTIVPRGQAKELELGLTLEVKPSIGNDGRSVMMELNLEIVDFLGFNSEFANEDGFAYKLPDTAETEIQTTVGVNSGQTVVLGGTLTNTVQRKDAKIPWLGEIPLIGWLFKRVEKTREPEHLLIFVTAEIVDLDGRYRAAEEQEAAAREAAEAGKTDPTKDRPPAAK